MTKRKRENGGEATKNGRQKNGEDKPKKKLIINAFVEMCKSKLIRATSYQNQYTLYVEFVESFGELILDSVQAVAISRQDYGSILTIALMSSTTSTIG